MRSPAEVKAKGPFCINWGPAKSRQGPGKISGRSVGACAAPAESQANPLFPSTASCQEPLTNALGLFRGSLARAWMDRETDRQTDKPNVK
jgi:hypothetical protein